MPGIVLKIIEQPEDFVLVEILQARIWTGSERDIVPAHLLLASVRNGGLVIGAFASGRTNNSVFVSEQDVPESAKPLPDENLVGFVFGFPAISNSGSGQKLHHHSHMLGVDPNYRDHGIGFMLKRAQWQMVRRQGIETITWTYDPLLSRNAFLNIARLGAVCNTYQRDFYGTMQDDLNAGLASDRFIVQWWLNSSRVELRLSKRPRRVLDLAHFLASDAVILNPTELQPEVSESNGIIRSFPVPGEGKGIPDIFYSNQPPAITLVEIPSDFQSLRQVDQDLGIIWRQHSRFLFEALFDLGYLVTDFIHLPSHISLGVNFEEALRHPESLRDRSFYVLSFGESTF